MSLLLFLLPLRYRDDDDDDDDDCRDHHVARVPLAQAGAAGLITPWSVSILLIHNTHRWVEIDCPRRVWPQHDARRHLHWSRFGARSNTLSDAFPVFKFVYPLGEGLRISNTHTNSSSKDFLRYILVYAPFTVHVWIHGRHDGTNANAKMSGCGPRASILPGKAANMRCVHASASFQRLHLCHQRLYLGVL